jgi:hypothetical protein
LIDIEASCLIRLSVASEAYGDDGYFALFTICFTCYIPKIKRLDPYCSVLREVQEAPRRFQTHPKWVKMYFIRHQYGLRRPEMHLRYYKTSKAFPFK